MSSIEVYAFEYGDGRSFGEYTTQDRKEAVEHAQSNGLRVIAHIYEWTSAEPVPEWDFTDSDEEAGEDTAEGHRQDDQGGNRDR